MCRADFLSKALAVLTLVFGPLTGAAKEVGPQDDWCGAIRTLPPGEELVLEPGEYPPCTITHGGTPDTPLVIRAKDPDARPRIVYFGQGTNALSIRAGHVTIRQLVFGPLSSDVDAVRIYAGNGITVEDSRFSEIGGSAIVATHASVSGVTIRRNDISQTGWTAIYLGCHDGLQCKHSNLLVEQNYIHGIDSPRTPGGDPGAGIQVKLNSTATIRDNVIDDTEGPGIMVYGAQDLESVSVIERNFVSRSRTSSAIVLGGGPAIVRNNVTIASAEAGIGLENYGRRGLLRGIVVAHNTVHGNRQGGISAPRMGRLEAKIVNNAAHTPAGTPAFPVVRSAVLSLGNMDCSRIPCFFAPTIRDFSPLAPRPGILLGEAWIPTDDYFGRRRGSPPTVGAIETPAGPIRIGIKAVPP